MKKTFRLLGIIALAAIIGLGMFACSDGGGDKPGDTNTVFKISGTFSSSADNINAAFFANEVSNVSASIRSARAALPAEIALEGLLEDGDITFRLKGSYNSETKIYTLSAAASFMRYSISGDLDSSEPGKAIVQIKTGDSWTSVEVSVEAKASGTDTSISDSGNIQDELDNGIPKEMWGAWYGEERLYLSNEYDYKDAGDYFYVIDAYTIILYVNRSGTWNVEGYSCFFEGVDVSNGIAEGAVLFDYTDHAKIEKDKPNWHIEALAACAKANGKDDESETLLSVLEEPDGWMLWSNPEWLELREKWDATSQSSGFTGEYWVEQGFSEEPYFFRYYKKDAYKLEGATLRMGNYCESNLGGRYFDATIEQLNNYSHLIFSTNVYFRTAPSETRLPEKTVVDPPKNITGNLGNYAFSKDHLDNSIILYDRAEWALFGSDLGIAQADDAKLVFEFTEPLANMTLVWGGGDNWWNDTVIIEMGEAIDGVTYSANTLTIDIPSVFKNYDNFKDVEYANLIMIVWGTVINEFGMTSANVTGTYDGPIDEDYDEE